MKFLLNIIVITLIIAVWAVFLGLGNNEEVVEKTLDTKTSDVLRTSDVQTFFVAKVFDGDTIQLADGNVVRYLGIDTPETSGPFTQGECFGKEATKRNEALVLDKKVLLEKDISEHDKYGRLLRHVFVGDAHVNLLLVEEGYAEAFPIPPDKKYREIFEAVEQDARESGVGKWKSCK